MNLELIEKLHKETEVTQLVQGLSPCWIWKGTKSDNYGFIRYNGSYWRLHRLSICLFTKVSYNGSWTANHICNVKLCWNPLHLYQGDMSSNTIDTIKAGNHYAGYNNAEKKTCPKGHPYNLVDKEGKRRCTICINAARQLKRKR